VSENPELEEVRELIAYVMDKLDEIFKRIEEIEAEVREIKVGLKKMASGGGS
jgi:Mg2+ and Co2+ transporter CorA